jgi:hypothetical protein
MAQQVAVAQVRTEVTVLEISVAQAVLVHHLLAQVSLMQVEAEAVLETQVVLMHPQVEAAVAVETARVEILCMQQTEEQTWAVVAVAQVEADTEVVLVAQAL